MAIRRLALLGPTFGLVLGCSPARGSDSSDDGRLLLDEMRNRSSETRPIAPRLSVDSRYRRCVPMAASERSGLGLDCRADSSTTPTREVLRLAARAGRAAAAGDAKAMHAAGLVDLLWADGEGKSLDRSISLLQGVARVTPRAAPILSDLSAALIVRAERRQTVHDLVEAIDVATRALELEPRYAPAQYNLALALSALALDDQAGLAAREYAASDSTSGWAAELRELERHTSVEPSPAGLVPEAPDSVILEFVARDHEAARRFGWDDALARWSELTLRGDLEEGARYLQLAERLGRALEENGGDATLIDAADDIHARERNAAAYRKLAAAHRDYAVAQRLYRAADYAGAGAGFARVVAAVDESTPLAQWADVYLAATLVYRRQVQAGEELFRRVIARLDTLRHPALAGRAYWSLGTTLLRQGRDDAANDAIETADSLFARVRERESLGAVRALHVDGAFSRGDGGEGYEAARRALIVLRPYRHVVWRHNVLYLTAQAAAGEGLMRAAAHLQDEGVAAAGGTGRGIDLAEGLLARARLRTAYGNDSGAALDVAEARAAIGRSPPGTARAWVEADLRLSEAVALMRARPHDAIAPLDSVVSYFGAPKNPLRLVPALAARAEGYAALGAVDSAVADLSHAARVLRARAADMNSVALRGMLYDQARRVFDRIVMLHIARGDSLAALWDLERVRESVSPYTYRSRALGMRRPGRQSSTTLVYANVADTLLTWTIADTVVGFARSIVDAAELQRTIDRVAVAMELRGPEDVTRPLLRQLYLWLVRPVEDRLGAPGSPISIIANGELAAIPFAALYDERTARYLVEDHPLRFANDLGSGAPKPELTDVGETLLIADPEFDLRQFPALSPLAGAEAEVASIAELYPEPSVVAGREARRSVLTAALPRARVVHYAGHAIFDDSRPDRSYLVLAADSTKADRLTAAEIARMSLTRGRLVVLSACQTIRGQRGSASGFTGLAGAFLTAGVSGVVGTLWSVDDRLTRPLMIEFHREYLKTGDGPGALRAAQIRLIRSADAAERSPAAWAAFRYVGG